MSSFVFRTCRAALAATAGCAMLVFGVPSAPAEPTTDALGFVDSSARCAAPDTAVAFGGTATSRVAICKSSGGTYEYRGVRISDGAKLVVPATESSDGGYVGEDDAGRGTYAGGRTHPDDINVAVAATAARRSRWPKALAMPLRCCELLSVRSKHAYRSASRAVK